MSVIRNAFTVGVFVLITRITGYLRECVMVFCLGAGMFTDAIFVALKLASTFRRIFAEGAFNASFLPRFLAKDTRVTVHDNVEDALRDADAVEVLRIQTERMKGGLFPSTREYARVYGLNQERLALCKDDVILLHPGPMNKGWEISADVAYCENSFIQKEVTNGAAVRMALYKLILAEEEN